MKLILVMYRLLYRLTSDRRWVIRYVDMTDKMIKKEIQQFYAEKEEQL